MEKELESLRAEHARLSAALKEATAEKIQAAQVGLKTVEEKEKVELKLTQLEERHQLTVMELENTKQQLQNFREERSRAALSGISEEESLLKETSSRESHLKETIANLENEKKNLVIEIKNLTDENKRLNQLYTESIEKCDQLEAQKKKYHNELKEVKIREQQLSADVNELEEENISLQKQISFLKLSQVGFESAKMEVKRLAEEVEDYQMAIEEANNLHTLVQKQLEEALQQAQQEREQKLSYKNELEFLKMSEHKNHLDMLLEMHDQPGNNVSALNRFELSYTEGSGDDSLGRQLMGTGNDLFSEISNDANKKVQQLETKLEEQKKSINDMKKAYVRAILPVLKELNVSSASENIDLDYLQELCNNAVSRLNEVNTAKSVEKELEKKVEQIKNNVREVILFGGKKYAECVVAKDLLISFGKQMNSLYKNLVGDQELESNRHVQEITNKLSSLGVYDFTENGKEESKVKEVKEGEEEEEQVVQTEEQTQIVKPLKSKLYLQEVEKVLGGKEQLATFINEKDCQEDFVFGTDESFSKVMEYTQDLVKITTRTALNAVNSKTKIEDTDVKEIISQNMKLKSQLATKREQIVTLRTVLKSNKTTAESAIASLKEKYDTEKAISHEIINRLRKELKILKEEAATFASHRAMFHSKNEELKEELKSAKEMQRMAEEEKKTVSALLRMAITQKLEAKQRLENMEIDRERQSFKRERGNKSFKSPNTGGQESKEVKTVRYPTSNNSTPKSGNK
uniref:Protein bicaudal D n=1 Tax=Strongyloides papillosus TaxID=174720 RepID=A0A0N5BEF1_STREA